MKRDTASVAGRRAWLRWCATILAVALVLVAVHQILPHHSSHARCPICVSFHRPSLAVPDAGIALPRPASFWILRSADEVSVHSEKCALTTLRGPPAVPVV